MSKSSGQFLMYTFNEILKRKSSISKNLNINSINDNYYTHQNKK